MSGTPDILHPIDRKQLDPRCYTASLIRQAVLCRLLSDGDLTAITTRLPEILAAQCRIWSRGESSSIPVEQARELMTSVWFAVDAALRSCPSPEQAVEWLKTEPLQAIYEKGLELVERKTAEARRRHRRILANLLETPNVYYRSTVEDGINGFFKWYRPRLAAHEIHITADYPVFAGRPEADGIEFIGRYLRCIEAENAFCVQFSPLDIHRLMCGLTPDYPNIPINLFEYVMLSALGLVLLGRSPRRLDLSPEEGEKLNRRFSGRTEGDIRRELEKGVSRLERRGLMPPCTRPYAAQVLGKLAFSVNRNAAAGVLHRVFLVPSDPRQERGISFDPGQTMDSAAYGRLVERILQTGDGREKVSLILRQVHSLTDLQEAVTDGELNREECGLLVSALPLPVFAALLSRFPEADLLCNEGERMLASALVERRENLSAGEKEQIRLMVKAMERR